MIGLAMDTNRKAPLCVQTLENTAKAYPGIRGAIIHSDRGSQYTSQLYQDTIRQYNIQQSMNSAGGRCHDNARCESMWARMKSELLYDRYDTEKMTTDELKTIIIHSAATLGVEIDEQGAFELARRSRGTPRLANRLLKRVRDFAEVKYDGKISKEVAAFALDLLEVDKLGLDQNDRNILMLMIEKFAGGPVGLDTLAAAIGEDAGTIEDVYEPYLVKNGFINRTPKGRVVTDFAYRHFGLTR